MPHDIAGHHDHSHDEKHFTKSEAIRDIVIGMADGLTVPFALAAGLTSVVAANNIIVSAGLAEVAAGSIAMGLGGYLAAKGDAEHYRAEKKREYYEIEHLTQRERDETEEILTTYGLTKEEAGPIVAALEKRPDQWVNFMMRFELGLEEPDPKRALKSALTIAGAYIFGGMIPLVPYMLYDNINDALPVSISSTLIALFLFGYAKGHATGTHAFKNGWQTALIGGLAAAAAFFIAGLFH